MKTEEQLKYLKAREWKLLGQRFTVKNCGRMEETQNKVLNFSCSKIEFISSRELREIEAKTVITWRKTFKTFKDLVKGWKK